MIIAASFSEVLLNHNASIAILAGVFIVLLVARFILEKVMLSQKKMRHENTGYGRANVMIFCFETFFKYHPYEFRKKSDGIWRPSGLPILKFKIPIYVVLLALIGVLIIFALPSVAGVERADISHLFGPYGICCCAVVALEAYLEYKRCKEAKRYLNKVQ